VLGGHGGRFYPIATRHGVVGALALTRLMSSMLFGVGARDPLTLGVTVLLLALVALAACFIPARRAGRVDPMVALRCE